MITSEGKDQLLPFSKHVPSILIRQVICKIAERFMMKSADTSGTTTAANETAFEPSIERFYGALLFVDISGFTQLSSRMNVDDLRTHINAYFSLIINIVSKHGGEVVKFAGDALYVIWQINRDVLTVADVNDGLKAVLVQAVACGTEINEKCTDYRITFSQKPGDLPSPSNGTVRRVAEAPLTSLRRAAGSDADIEVIFLNVHAGVSAGLLAGICIGAMDRWEYLLLGQPLQCVAQAEGQAQKGQLVICPVAHSLLHPAGSACTCKATPEQGCFVVYDGSATGKKFRMRKPEPKLQSLDALADYEAQFLADVNKFTMSAFHSWVPDNSQQGGRSRSTTQTSVEDRMSNHNSTSNSMSLNSNNISGNQGHHRAGLAKLDVKGNNGVVLPSMPAPVPSNPMLDGFTHYVKTELTNALARYVHDAARNGYHFSAAPPRHEVLLAALEKASSLNGKEQVSPSTKRRSALFNPFKFNLFFTSNKPASVAAAESSTSNVPSGAPVQTAEAAHHPVRDGVTKRSAARKGSVEMLPSTDLIAELRSVIVSFINIDFPEKHELFVEGPSSSSSIFNLDATDLVENKINNFHFLARSKREFEHDQSIMQSFQRCYVALISCLHSKGGQLRQFIIDDKGIVCIGTFGLRGSNNDDNAAAAIEACNNIKRSLQAINIEAYVGITSGKVYCGLVGSLTRHEYAVMGPSVNLSARLMARATMECQDLINAAEGDRSILCDLEIQSRDRVHTFDSLGTIKAKGYSQPVAIYSPQLESLKERKRRHSTRSRQSASSIPEASSNDEDCKSVTSHEDDEPPKRGQPKKSPNNRKKSMVANDGSILGNISFGKEASSLYGRKNELQSIFNFLITKVCVVEKNSSGKKALKSLHTSKPAVIICLRGSQGIGKSSLMQNLCSVIDGVRYQNNPLNIFIAHHQISNFLSSEMLSLWKVLLPEVMTAMLYQLQKRSSKQDGLHIIDIDSCLSYMRQKNASEFNKFSMFYPLIGLYSHGTETSDNAVINLTGQGQNISAFIVYVTKLLQGLIDETGFAPIFALDDLQWMDATSWQLVKSIYQHCKGVIFITTVRPKVNAAPPSSSAAITGMIKALTPKHGSIRSAGQEHHYHDLQSANHKSSTVHVEELLVHSDSNVMSLTLHPLTSAAVDELVQDAYKKQFTESADLAALSKRIFDLSGGNPLYATELSKIAMERLNQELNGENSSHDAKNNVAEINWSNILSFQSGRIEEVIFYRFDQLDFTSQVLLKAASVVCSHGANFTMHMLTFVINSSNYFNSDYGSPSHTNTKSQAHAHLAYSADLTQLNLTNSIILALQKLTEKNAFIKILKEKRKSMSSMKNDKMPTGVSPVNTAHILSTRTQGEHSAAVKLADEISLETNFHFIATVEQHAIYNIMTDDQKQLLHRCVAEYYHVTFIHNLPCASPLIADRDADNSQPSRTMNVFEYVEQARHYEKAKMYRDSLYCYYRAISMQIDMGVYENYHEQLEYLYYILQHSLVHNHSTNHFSNAKTGSNHATLLDSESNPDQNSCHNLRKSILCRQSLSFLKISLHVLLLLMKSFLFGKQDLPTVAQLSEEAHLIILTLLEHANGAHQEHSGHCTMSRVRIATRTESNPSYFNTRESFVDIHSHHTVYDSVLIVLLNDYLNITSMQLHQPEYDSGAVSAMQISSAVDLFDRLSASQEMQACVLLASVRRILNGLTIAISSSELSSVVQRSLSAMAFYTESFAHISLELTAMLGVDLLPYTFTMLAQRLMVRSESRGDAETIAMKLLSIVSKVDNQAMAMAAIPLTLVLTQLGKPQEAFELYHVKFFAKRKADKVDYLPQPRTSMDDDHAGRLCVVTKQMLEEFDFYVQAAHWHAQSSQAPREILVKMAESDVMKRLTVGSIKKHPNLHLTTTSRQHEDEKLRGMLGVTFHAVRAQACFLMHALLSHSNNPPFSADKILSAAKGHLEHCVRSRKTRVETVVTTGDELGGFEDMFVSSLAALSS